MASSPSPGIKYLVSDQQNEHHKGKIISDITGIEDPFEEGL